MNEELPDLVVEARKRMEALSVGLAQRIGPDHAATLLLAHGIAIFANAQSPAQTAAMLRGIADELDAEGRNAN